MIKKVSYALGISLGTNLLNSGVKELDIAEFSAGIADVLAKKDFNISMNEAQAVLNEYFDRLENEKHKTVIEESKTFLAKNAARKEVTTLPSGLQYEILTQGSGATPKASDTVKVHYHGTLPSGEVFDSSIKRGTPATFGVTQVIKGWVEALQLMSVGSKWRLFIPADLAYGSHGAGSIPPHSALVFDVELLGIES